MSRAVVLGGGGVAGIAWATGVAAGMARKGVDITHADAFVGTSAGSVVGAQIASASGLRSCWPDNSFRPRSPVKWQGNIRSPTPMPATVN